MTLGELWASSPFLCILFIVFTPYGLLAVYRDLLDWWYPMKGE